MNWFNNVYHIAIIIIVLMLIDTFIIAILAKTMGKKFDRLLDKQNMPYPISVNFFALFNWGRTNLYAANILFFKNPIGRNSFRYRNYRKRFGDFCFKDYATKSDYILSIIHVTLITATVLIFICMAFIKS